MKKKMLFMTLFLVTAVTSFQKMIAMRNLIGLFFLSVALAACTSAPRNEVLSYTDFPRTLELKGRTLPLDTALFRYPFRIRVQGDRAVVLDLHGEDCFCHAFSYPAFCPFPLSAGVAKLPASNFPLKMSDGAAMVCGFSIPISPN